MCFLCGGQFEDMLMGNEKDKLCTSTFRWQFVEKEGKWLNLGCRVIDPVVKDITF